MLLQDRALASGPTDSGAAKQGGEAEEEAQEQAAEASDSDDDGDASRAAERQLAFSDLVKGIGHAEVIKFFMFLLERYRTLDGPTVHAVATFLQRLCGELALEPLLYQVCARRHPPGPAACPGFALSRTGCAHIASRRCAWLC